MDPIIIVFLFLFGCVIGSFLNVCIYRIPREKSIVSPPSACPGCEEKIRPWQNIPIISFLLLKGRCYNCKIKISVKYPLVELLTGLLTLAVYFWFGLSYEGLAALTLLYHLVAVVYIDIEFRIIPDRIIIAGLLTGGIIHVAGSFMAWSEILIGGLIGSGFLLFTFYLGKLLFKKDSVGGGDIKLGFMLGIFLGTQNIIVGLFSSYIFASLIGGGSKILKGKAPVGEIPFGPYLALGSATALFFGDKITAGYFALIGF